MDWGYVIEQGNILVIVYEGSGWTEAFSAGNRTSETVKVYLSQIFAIIILLTSQSYVRSKFSCQQKLDSNIHRPPTNEINCTWAMYDSQDMLMKIENHLQDSELKCVRMSIM